MTISNISGCILSYNHEWCIKRAIRSLMPIVSEIIVFDAHSNDKTSFIAKTMNVKVIGYEYENLTELKSCLESLCTNNWIFVLHANEFVSEGLQNEISYIFKNNIQNRYKAYQLRISMIGNEDLELKKFAPNTQEIRLYNKECSTLNYDYDDLKGNKSLCSVYANENEIYRLKSTISMRLRLYLDPFIDQVNNKSSSEVKRLSCVVKTPSILRIIFEPFFVFLYTYFIRRYFLLGFGGFLDAYLISFQRRLFLAKLRERKAFFYKQ
jgi:hypothetical protein